MFKKILIANRGEIACRIIRAAREMGIKTVAVHSDVDRDCLHTRMADQAICIGPYSAKESYLNVSSIIAAAEISGADAIHPGYGFLAESTDFAEICESCGIKFIGPSKTAIEKMGDKIAAKGLMKKSGVPVVPGSDGPITVETPNLLKLAKKIGYPVIVKASAGGGGKGMRVVNKEEELKGAIAMAMAEAKASFSDETVYMEKYIEEPHHIEFQILGDCKGKVVYLPERDCSIQRRHQKLVEESPSPFMTEPLRRRMGRAARLAAAAVNYVTVGTIEFLVDKHSNFYFMEMNTRIQVEHPVTDMVTGIDLVKEQIKLAAGEKLSFDSEDIQLRGHAIELRINAENPEKDFMPCPGKVTQFVVPGGPGIRVESHIYSGYTIPPYYDSMIAKVISLGVDREEAIIKLQRALREMIIEGVETTASLHKKILSNENFAKGNVATDFLQKNDFLTI